MEFFCFTKKRRSLCRQDIKDCEKETCYFGGYTMSLKKNLTFLSIQIVLSLVFILPTYADEGDIENFILSADGAGSEENTVKAEYDSQTNTMTISGSGLIDRNKWIDLARKINPNAFSEYDKGWELAEDNPLNMVFEGSDGDTIAFPSDSTFLFSHIRGTIDFNTNIDTSGVINMWAMFYKSEKFNEDITDWDTSNVYNFSDMFSCASSFNQDISSWDTSSATHMHLMFYQASSFDQDISTWDTSNVISIYRMFEGASSFNQDLSSWDTSALVKARHMFYRANALRNIDLLSRRNANANAEASGLLNSTTPDSVRFDKLQEFTWTVTDNTDYWVRIDDGVPQKASTLSIWDDGSKTFTFEEGKKYELTRKEIPNVDVVDFTKAYDGGALRIDDGNIINPDNISGTWTVDSTEEIKEIGAYQALCTFTPDDANAYAKTKVYVNITIDKADPEFSLPDNLRATVGDALSTITLPSYTNGSLAFVDSTQTVGEVGTFPISVVFTPNDRERYKIVHTTVNISVSEKSSSNGTVSTESTETRSIDLSSTTSSSRYRSSSYGNKRKSKHKEKEKKEADKVKQKKSIIKGDTREVENDEVRIDGEKNAQASRYARKYHDVKQSDWFKDAVYSLSGKGLLLGISEDSFDPKAATNKAMILSVIYRMSGGDVSLAGEKKIVDDVDSSAWYADALAWAGKNKLVSSYSLKTVKPLETISREEFVLTLYKYAQYRELDSGKRMDLNAYRDREEISSDAKEAFEWAIASGIIVGMPDKTLSPKGETNRAEMAIVFDKFNNMFSH